MDKYFITGSSYFIDKNIKNLITEDENADIEIFFGDELNKGEFLGYINSISFTGSPKVAVLRNFNKIKDKGKDLEHFVESISKCSECILLISAEIKDKEEKFYSTLFQNNNFKVLKEEIKKQRATIDDVIRIFKEKNIMLNYSQAELFLNKCLNNLSMVSNEAEKMELYILSQKEKVPISLLLEQLSGEKEETIYALTDSFGMRDVKNTLKIYSTMDNSSDKNFQIFFALSRRIYNIYLLFIDGSMLKRIPDFQLIRIKEQQTKWTLIEIIKIIDKLSELDKNIKTGAISINNAVLSLILLSNKDK